MADDNGGPWRTLSGGQLSQVWTAGVDGDEPTLVFESDRILVEAPNWSRDGRALYLNGNGRLWRLDLDDDAGRGTQTERDLVEIPHEGLPPINNDHVLSPDGESIFLSAGDRHIYRASLSGGPVTRVSPDDGRWHFLHGVSRDATRLAYVEITTFDEPGRLVVAPVPGARSTQGAGSEGSPARIDTGPGHIDGPEWSADDEWIYFNTERWATEPGHAQLARIRDGDGAADVERLVTSTTVDWFPHPSPSGEWATYISFPAGTLGHPADLDVVVHLVRTSDWSTPVASFPLLGGQGTINVNSWAPDSSRFAFVGYPVG
ncbi:TolB family protein [Frondihabitans australicus]|uniref:WD40 repeat protein n=1 Tax=Frondihabitans australicus TaxID=386892 RepID=A0A495IC00_9MICO|nr:PD40 domain-containing protein [Frondihabitans australicus]RKR73452.1 WD40 repeat protein [Frondihabitans australicus]